MIKLKRVVFENELLKNEELKKFGKDLLGHMMTASVQESMGGLGGCKKLDWSIFPEEHIPYIKRYLKERTSCWIVYQAMKDKEAELAKSEEL